MNDYKNLFKQIEGLNVKINKLDSVINSSQHHTTKKTPINIANHNSEIRSFRIHHPIESHNGISKKYVGLIFDSNLNNFDSDELTDEKTLSSFIKLTGSNIIINYFIQLDLNFTFLESTVCSIALGIKTKTDSKIKIIKGTKHQFDLSSSNIINSKLTISNTILYSSEIDDDLCMITDLCTNCIVNNKKSIIKLLNV